jgi:hypothetical protein
MSDSDANSGKFIDEPHYIAQLRSELENSYREFDKLILTVSSGILALSVSFFSGSAAEHHLAVLLMASWVFFLLAIVSVAVSFLAEQKHKRHLLSKNGESDDVEKKLGKRIKVLNLSSGGAFLLGIVFLFLYLMFNVKGVW